MTGVRVIRAFNKEDAESDRLKTANTNLTDVTIKVNKLMAFLMPLMMLLMNLTVVAIIWFGGIRIDGGNMQIGDLMAFIQYVMQIMFSLVMASMMFVMLPRAAVSANRVNEVLQTKPTITDKDRSAKTGYANEKGSLEFDHVTFHYPGAEEPALKDIDFRSKPGEITAIIGGTGSGKSTLVNLIPRFYDVTEGSIRLNGVDIRETNQADVRSRIGLVPQKAFYFRHNCDNIRYGKTDASIEDVRWAAKVAQADDFISDMENGYDTNLDQGGTNLSGGQKQRLAIARALVRRPDLYVLMIVSQHLTIKQMPN